MAVRRILLPWDSQPQEAVGVNWECPTNSTITSLLPLGVDNRDILSGNRLTLGSGGSVAVDQRGKSLLGSGSAAVGSVAVNLSAYNRASVSFWLYWDGYANDDDFAMEFTTNSNSLSGFYVDPNYSGAGGQFGFQMGDGAGNRKTAYMARSLAPAATWNHLYLAMDRNAAGNGIAVWVNGVAASLTSVNTDTLSGNFANDSLYLFSRASSALFGAGRLQNLVIRGGFLGGAADARQEYWYPWQLFAPRSIWVPVSAGGGAPTLALTGYAATGSAGILVPALSLAVAGNGATAAQGTATPSLSKAITGNAVTASAGTPVASISLALTGNAATASVGTVGIGGTTQALTGNAATASAGTPVAVISLALTGNGATSSVGTATPALSKAITGNAATTAVGTPVAGLSLALSGNGATSACGTVEVPGVIVPSSSVATTAAGTVTPGISIALTGNGATASVGSVSPAISLALSGLAGTSSAGIVIPGLSLALSGNAAAAATGTIAVATGDATVALTGNLATAYAGSLGIGGAVGLSEWWRYDVPVNDMRYAVPVHNLRYDVDTENLT